MKLKLITLSFLFLFLVPPFQDSKTDLLCNKKWNVQFLKNGQTKMDVSSRNLWMQFYKDGKHVVGSDELEEIGTWKFSKNKDSLLIVTEAGNDKALRLDTLTSEKLHFFVSDKKQQFTMMLHAEKKKP